MQDPAYFIVSFDRTTATMEAERLFKARGIDHAIMPTPRAVQASCGLSIRFSPEDLEQVKEMIGAALEEGIFHCYQAVKDNGHTSFQQM